MDTHAAVGRISTPSRINAAAATLSTARAGAPGVNVERDRSGRVGPILDWRWRVRISPAGMSGSLPTNSGALNP